MLSREYRKYLASPTWQRRRKAFRDSHGGVCVICGRWGPDVHHMTYRPGEFLRGRERDDDLVLLCREHHRLVHAVHTRRGGDLRDVTMSVIRAGKGRGRPRVRRTGRRRTRRVATQMLWWLVLVAACVGVLWLAVQVGI